MPRWISRLGRLLRRRRFDAGAAAEMGFHIDMEIRERIAAGMDPAEARRTALRDFGGVQRYRQQVREERWGAGLEVVLQDLRFGFRTLARSPNFTLAAVLTIAIAVAANTAVYTLVHSALIDPLPYDEAHRIQQIRTGWRGSMDLGASPAEVIDYVTRLEGFESVGAYHYSTVALSADGGARRVQSAVITSGVLPSLGVQQLAAGRLLTDEDGLSQGAVVLVGHDFWTDEVGGAADAIGGTLTLNGQQAEIVGVLPPGFRLPDDLASSAPAQIYGPRTFDPATVTNRGTHFLSVIGRLADGVSAEQGRAALDRLVAAMAREHLDAYPPDMEFRVILTPVAEFVTGDVRPALLLLAGAVLVILLITCSNVAALMLARSEERRREFGVRAALGASKARLSVQVFAESLMLALTGGALGLWGAATLLDTVARTRPIDLPGIESVQASPGVIAFGLVVAMLAGIAFGIVPALQASPRRLDEAVNESPRGGVRATRNLRLRHGLVVGQLALSLMLLAAAGLLGRTLVRLQAVDPGVHTQGVMTGRLGVPSDAYPDDDDVTGFYRNLTARLAARNGIEAVGAVTSLPLATVLGDMGFEIEGRPVAEGTAKPAADWQAVTPGYFDALGIDLVRGRLIDERDAAEASGVVVINEAFARQWWPGEDPIGRRFLLGGGTGPGMVEVVGIVEDVRHASLTAAARSEMYLAHAQFRSWINGRALRTLTVVVRSGLPSADVAGLLRATVAEIDPMLPVYQLQSMTSVRSATIAQPRLMTLLLATFAAVALLLATVGTYGLIAYQVRLRDRELGIRMALGAAPNEVGALVLRQGLRLAVAGLGLGLMGALAMSGSLSGLLYGVAPSDPLTLTAVSAFLGAVALLAAWIPARRAARTSPVQLLRED